MTVPTVSPRVIFFLAQIVYWVQLTYKRPRMSQIHSKVVQL